MYKRWQLVVGTKNGARILIKIRPPNYCYEKTHEKTHHMVGHSTIDPQYQL